MKPLLALALAALVLPAFAVAPGTSQPLPSVGQRVYALVMNGNGFNGFSYPDTPLLEAYAGESLLFAIAVPAIAEAHVFHLHGHPWYDPSQSRFVDAKLLQPGDTHRFEVTAGGLDENAGDWMYHCHFDVHFEHGMWGILRVYPFAMTVSGTSSSLQVELQRRGAAVEGAAFEATIDGAPVAVGVREGRPGSYTLGLPLRSAGALVITAHAEQETSVWRGVVGVQGLSQALGPVPLRAIAGPAAHVGHAADATA